MTRAWHRRLLLSLVTLTALVVSGGPGAGATAPLTATQEARGPIPMEAALPSSAPAVTPQADRVVIVPDSVTPTVVNRSTPIEVRGTVTARTDVPLSGARVRLVTEPTSLRQRGSVEAWAGSRRAARGTVVAEAALPPVAAGQTTTFTLSVPAGRITSSEVFAALPVSLEVVPSAGAVPSGVTHTFLAWQSRKEYVPLRVATLLPLTLEPDVDLWSRDEAVRTAAWTEHLGPGSRLDQIIEGSVGSAATLVVDPSLFGPELTSGDEDTPTPGPTGTASPSVPSPTPSNPSSTSPAPPNPSPTTPSPTTTAAPSPTTTAAPSQPGATPGPEESPGAGSPTAGIPGLVADLRARLLDRDVWALPYADADLAATVDVAPTNSLVRDLVERAELVATVLDKPARSDVFLPVDGTLTTARDRNLKTLVSGTDLETVGGVVVSQDAITVESVYTPSAVRVTPTGTRLLAFDNALSALLPERGESAVLTTQQFLAESLVLLGERPGTQRAVVLATPRDFDPDAAGLATFFRALASADWLTPVGADTLLAEPGPGTPLVQQNPKPAPVPIAPPPVLSAKRLADLADQRDTLLQVATVLRDGAAFEATYRELLDELASARWRSAPEAWQDLSDSVVADTQAATSAIKVVPQGVNFLAAHGILRITVRNGLDYTVDGIRLVVEPSNPRMTVEQPEPITIGPGALTTVRVPATALAAGRVDIKAYLTTADGTPIGQPAIMRVSANPLDSTFYWVGAILVGLVLLFGLVRTIRKGTSRVDEIGDLETVAAEVRRREEAERR